MNEKITAHTSEETEQELSELAEKLEAMDKAEGFFGEAVTDEELEDVAGGAPLIPSQAPHPATCEICGFAFGANYPPTKCLGRGAAYECPYVKTGR